jgi:hypothetical protein
MNFTPKTEKEIAEMGNLPKGAYPFEVLNAVAKQSKSGNDMIELQLLVFTPSGGQRKMRDWIMEKVARKLYNFCANNGLKAKYDAGTLTAEDCLGANGYLFLGIEKGREKDDGSGNWPDRNSVADYIDAREYRELTGDAPAEKASLEPVKASAGASPAAEDDVPF